MLSGKVDHNDKVDDDNIRSNGTLGDQISDEDLGSELSGISVEVPDEVDDVARSANYLPFYDRNYKSGVLQIIKRGGRNGQAAAQVRYKFPSNEENQRRNKSKGKL